MAFHAVSSNWLRTPPSTSTDDIKLLSMIERAAAKRIHELKRRRARARRRTSRGGGRRRLRRRDAATSAPARADDDEDDPQHPEEIAHFTRVIESFLQYGDITKRHVADTERRERALGPSALAMLPPSAVDRKAKLMHAAAEGNAVRARCLRHPRRRAFAVTRAPPGPRFLSPREKFSRAWSRTSSASAVDPGDPARGPPARAAGRAAGRDLSKAKSTLPRRARLERRGAPGAAACYAPCVPRCAPRCPPAAATRAARARRRVRAGERLGRLVLEVRGGL